MIRIISLSQSLKFGILQRDGYMMNSAIDLGRGMLNLLTAACTVAVLDWVGAILPEVFSTLVTIDQPALDESAIENSQIARYVPNDAERTTSEKRIVQVSRIAMH